MSDWYPHVTVATVVERENQYLLVEEIADGMQVFNQPAGHLERNETLVDAAIRETLEETGWHVEILHGTGIYLYESPHNQVTYLRCCFAAKAITEDVTAVLDEGIIGPRWMTLNEIKQQQASLRSPLVTKCIEDYETGASIPLSLIEYSLLASTENR